MQKELYYDPALIKGNTKNGEHWLAKAAHPPGSIGTDYNGFPDKSTIPAIHFEFRNTVENTPLVSNALTTILLLCSPGILHPIFAASKLDTGTAEDPQYVSWLTNTNTNNADIVNNWGKERIAYLSNTFQYDATGFNNSGMVYVAQFSPSVFVLDITEAVTTMVRNKQTKLLDSLISTLKKKYPKIKEFIEAHKTGIEESGFEVLPSKRPSPRAYGINNVNFQVVRLGQNVSAPGDIKMLSPKSYQARSTEGAFVVHQMNQDINTWKDIRQSDVNSGISNDDSLMFCLYEYTDAVNNITYLEAFKEPIVGTILQDAPWSDWTWSYVMFTGVQNATTGGNPPTINVNNVQGVEMAPMMRSSFNSLVRPPALYDPEALKNWTIISQARQDGLPAKYNEDGMFNLAHIGNQIAGEAVGNVMEGLGMGKKEGKKAIEEAEKAEAIRESGIDTVEQAKTPVVKIKPMETLNSRFSRMSVTRQPTRARKQYVPKQRTTIIYRNPPRRRSSSRNRSQSRNRSTSKVRFAPRKRSTSRNRQIVTKRRNRF